MKSITSINTLCEDKNTYISFNHNSYTTEATFFLSFYSYEVFKFEKKNIYRSLHHIRFTVILRTESVYLTFKSSFHFLNFR